MEASLEAWEEEFDKNFMDWVVSGDDGYGEIKAFIRRTIHILLHSSIQKAREEEEERWINQPANKHDEEIRKAERERIKKAINESYNNYGYDDGDGGNAYKALSLLEDYGR